MDILNTEDKELQKEAWLVFDEAVKVIPTAYEADREDIEEISVTVYYIGIKYLVFIEPFDNVVSYQKEWRPKKVIKESWN